VCSSDLAVLGVVEGLTEYLPVSSTGHLLLAQRLMGLGGEEKTADDAYAIAIQAGAILAVLGLYSRRIKEMCLGLGGRHPAGLRLLLNLLLAFIPAAVFGLLLEKTIKSYLFGLWPITLAWLAGGLAILIVSRRWNKGLQMGLELDELPWSSALLIGFFQVVAMWPGTSRSLMTILGGASMGLTIPAAVEFSFLLGLVTLGAATAYEVFFHGSKIVAAFGWLNPLIGFVLAFVSAAGAMKWLVAYLTRHSLASFGWYRICLALAVAGVLAAGRL
jgi:undecaprenyl-diphosphatase